MQAADVKRKTPTLKSFKLISLYNDIGLFCRKIKTNLLRDREKLGRNRKKKKKEK